MTTSHTRFHPLHVLPVALALIFNVAFGPFAPVVSSLDRLTAQAADAPVVTLEDGVNGCMGVRPTPGSENTDKKLVGGTLEPGSTVTFEISYPVSASDVTGRTTFVITDCIFINDTPILKYSVSFVPNTENYILTYDVPIPSNTPIGAEYCNYAKTTAAPSDSPASNRKAGPACFIVGGALRVLKVDQNGDPLAGADFNVTCTLPTTDAYLARTIISAGGVDYPFDSTSGLVVSKDVTTGSDGVIAVQAPDATSCTFTETSPPPGYLLASPSSHTMTVDASQQETYTFVDTVPQPNLSITKTADATPVNAGDNIGFGITVSNSNDTGTGTAKNVTLNDPLPTGVTWSIDSQPDGNPCSITSNTLSCSFGDLAKGDSVSVHVTASTSAAACATYPNTATASADNNADVQASATIVCQKPEISITKTADDPSVNAGEPIGFTVTISNSGDGQATGLSFTDALPSGTGIDWSISPASSGWSISGSAPNQSLVYAPTTLAANSSTSVHIVSNTGEDSCATYSNTAQVSTSNDGSGKASAETAVLCPSIHITKTADDPSVSAGEPIGFTVTISNSGDGQATGLSFTDALPSGTGIDWSISPASSGWSISGSAPNQSLVYAPTTMDAHTSTSVHVVSNTTKDSCATYSNTAKISASNEESNKATAETTVLCPDVKVVKTADDPSVNAGDAIGFSLTVTNLGPGAAKGVTLSDTLPAATGVDWSIDDQPAGNPCGISTGELSCSFGDMAASASVTVHITSPTTGESCGTITNTADVSATNEPSSNLGNNEDSASTNVICPDVKVVKTADNGTISAGDTAAFTIVVSNIGEGTAYNVTLDDQLPVGVSWNEDSGACTIDSGGDLSCSWDTLASGGSATIHVWGQTDAADCGVLHNTATVAASNEAEADSENNSSSADITVECPNLSATKTADGSPVSAGNQIGFTITISNSDAAGTGTAHDVALNDPLPAGADLNWSIADQPAGNPCSISGSAGSQTLECSFGDLASGGSVSVHVVSGTATADCSTLPNVATVTASNNPTLKPSADVTVECPGLNVAKTAANSSINGGDTASFTIKVWNIGSGTALGAQLDDPLPGGGGNLSWSIDPAYTGPGTCTITGAAGSQALHCDFGDLAGGTSLAEPSASITVVANTTRSDCGTLPNEATASASNSDAVTADASIDVTCPAIEIVKSNNQPNPVLPGADVTYMLNVTVSDGPANNVTVVDTLPAGLDDPTSISNSGVWNSGDRTITWHFDSLDNGDPAITLSYHAVVSASDTHGQVLTNNVYVTSTNTQCPDTETLNAKCQSQSDVTIRVPTLVIDKAASVGEVHFVFNADGSVKSVTPDGAQVTWTLTYTLTNGPVTNAVISDPLPDYLTFVSADNGGTYDAGTRTVTWQLGTLSASGSVSFLTTVDSDAPETGPIVNVASIVSDQTPKDTGEDGVLVTSEQVQAATPTPSVPNTAVLEGQNGQPIQIPIELLVVFFLGSLGVLTLANVKAVRRRR